MDQGSAKNIQNPKIIDIFAAQALTESIVRDSVHALDRIRPYVLLTPLITSRVLSEVTDCDVLLKCEHRQVTGSFKIRGALNKLLSLPRRSLDEGVVVASTGNHGAAVAYACRLLGGKCIIVVPEDVRPVKERSMRAFGAQVEKHGEDGLEAERYAREWAERDDLEYISPYNDTQVITGQATVAAEFADDLDADCDVYVAVGGGGLISGMAAVLKDRYPRIRIVGCSPENHPVMDESVKAGRIVNLPYKPTLSDGTAGRLESDSITLPLCRLLVDDWIRVSESEIVDSLHLVVRGEHMIVEGSAAVAVAALRKDSGTRSRKRIVVLCGGNVDKDLLTDILQSPGTSS